MEALFAAPLIFQTELRSLLKSDVEKTKVNFYGYMYEGPIFIDKNVYKILERIEFS